MDLFLLFSGFNWRVDICLSAVNSVVPCAATGQCSLALLVMPDWKCRWIRVKMGQPFFFLCCSWSAVYTRPPVKVVRPWRVSDYTTTLRVRCCAGPAALSGRRRAFLFTAAITLFFFFFSRTFFSVSKSFSLYISGPVYNNCLHSSEITTTDATPTPTPTHSFTQLLVDPGIGCQSFSRKTIGSNRNSDESIPRPWLLLSQRPWWPLCLVLFISLSLSSQQTGNFEDAPLSFSLLFGDRIFAATPVSRTPFFSLRIGASRACTLPTKISSVNKQIEQEKKF